MFIRKQSWNELLKIGTVITSWTFIISTNVAALLCDYKVVASSKCWSIRSHYHGAAYSTRRSYRLHELSVIYCRTLLLPPNKVDRTFERKFSLEYAVSRKFSPKLTHKWTYRKAQLRKKNFKWESLLEKYIAMVVSLLKMVIPSTTLPKNLLLIYHYANEMAHLSTPVALAV